MCSESVGGKGLGLSVVGGNSVGGVREEVDLLSADWNREALGGRLCCFETTPNCVFTIVLLTDASFNIRDGTFDTKLIDLSYIRPHATKTAMSP
jgi:hypothetical protein